MKLIELITQHDLLSQQMYRVDVPYCFESSDMNKEDIKAKEEELKKHHENVLAKLKDLDEMYNRILEAMATHYIEFRGIKMSLMTMYNYLSHYNTDAKVSFLSEKEENIANVRDLYGECSLPRLNYLWLLSTASYEARTVEDGEIFIDPLELGDASLNFKFEFLAEMKSVYIQQIATVEV